jgi:hypothetical protein
MTTRSRPQQVGRNSVTDLYPRVSISTTLLGLLLSCQTSVHKSRL